MTEKITIIATLTRSELARLQRQLNHKQQAEQLERFIADSGYLMTKPQLLQLADQELDSATEAWSKTRAKYGFEESDNVEVDFGKMQIVKKEEVEDAGNDESGDANNAATSVEGLQQFGDDPVAGDGGDAERVE